MKTKGMIVKITGLSAALIAFIASLSVSTASLIFLHQPKAPRGLQK